ncbi:MAG: CinA family protein [Candidatus Methanoplasma sp.]|jgi:PncC family amidohydrolase|nr:CinA family protein [Candidatus Methanoplasma sp.]
MSGMYSAEDILSIFTGKGYTLSVAESCTGGLIGTVITSVPGASAFFLGSAVVYANVSKESILGVRHSTLEKFGAVSRETAKEMAEGAVRVFGSDISVSATGIAGPTGGSAEKPVGLVYVAVSNGKTTKVEEFRFTGDRDPIRYSAVAAALGSLIKFTEEIK